MIANMTNRADTDQTAPYGIYTVCSVSLSEIFGE